jgi:hypothetical protein
MKTNILKMACVIIALGAIGGLCLAGGRAEPTSSSSKLTTNWTGCLVVGRHDPVDSITRGLFPATIREVEIGLRSDGVIVWREASKIK